MRNILNCVLYNEQDNITGFLDRVRKIRDLYAVEILDGSWSQEVNANVKSTDHTKALVEDWRERNFVPFEVNFTESDHIWRTESEKRNHLLKITEEKHGSCWIIILDADEEIKFPNGMVHICMTPLLTNRNKCGVVMSYPYNAIGELPGIRLIPSKIGVHYHTEYAMMLHDHNCKLLMDYNPQRIFKSWDVFDFKDMFIVNYWALRNNARQYKKYFYSTWQSEHLENKELKCQWIQS